MDPYSLGAIFIGISVICLAIGCIVLYNMASDGRKWRFLAEISMSFSIALSVTGIMALAFGG